MVWERIRGALIPALVTSVAVGGFGGCAPVPAQEPIIDKTGVDEGKYSRDLANCFMTMPVFALGNPLATCMREKGYMVLVSR
jgi:hypothetical protein